MAKQTSVVKISRPRVETTYSFEGEVGHLCGDNALSVCRDTVQEWISAKLPYELPAAARSGESYLVDEGGQRVEAVSIPEKEIWSVRLSHPDVGIGEIPPIAGRYWTIDASVKRANADLKFAIRVQCSTPNEIVAPVSYVRPGIIRGLIAKAGLRQVRHLSEEPWILRSEAEIDELEELVISADRRFPVILITQPVKRKWTYSPAVPAYMLDGLYLAQKAVGYAHIVLMPYQQGFLWTNRIGMTWSAFDGAVRLYMPGLDFNEDTLRQHPVQHKEQIHSFAYETQTGGRAFAKWLVDRLASFGGRRYVSHEGATFVPDARLIQADFRAEQVARLTNIGEIRSRYEEQIKALRQKLEEAEQEAAQWSDASIADKKEAERIDQENKILRRQNDVLRKNLSAKTDIEPDNAIKIPDKFEEMANWVQEHLTGRLVLHPRAIRGLKDAIYEDVKLAYKALLLLANEYRNMRLGSCEKEVYDGKCMALELRDSQSISEERAGEEDDTYFVKYPFGSSRNRFLERHLRKGSTKNDRLCFGIYFFWDEDTGQVVVGWLPSHLQNRLT